MRVDRFKGDVCFSGQLKANGEITVDEFCPSFDRSGKSGR
jgi:hypothetical protein